MPLFKITSSESTGQKLISANSIADIIESAKTKFNLPDREYKILSSDDHTEIDEDEVLLHYADERFQQQKGSLTILVVPANTNSMQIVQHGSSSAHEDNAVQENGAQFAQMRLENRIEKDLEEKILNKASTKVINACLNKVKLLPGDRLPFVNAIADYMIDVLKNFESSTADKIAAMICSKYPETFLDRIKNTVIGKGHDSLKKQIYNCINYKKIKINSAQNTKKRSRENCDSDEENENPNKSNIPAPDEYGCVAYAPPMPDEETEESQEIKRGRLCEMFAENYAECEDEALKLMSETYTSQRGVIIADNRNMNDVVLSWPFLQHAKYLIEHATTLLGKDITRIWQDSMKDNAKSIRAFFSLKNSAKNKTENVTKILTHAKEARLSNKNKIPKYLVIFPLILQHFNEKESNLFKIIDVSVPKEEILQHAEFNYPSLIIQGHSLYDENAEYFVVIEKKIKIICNDAVQALLATFVSYYVFGYRYPVELGHTLEFIQRYLLEINPTVGSKKSGKKKRAEKSFDGPVYKLITKLESFKETSI